MARRSAQAGPGCADGIKRKEPPRGDPAREATMRLTVIGTLAAGVLLLSACTEAAPSAAPVPTPSTPAWALFEGPSGLEVEADQGARVTLKEQRRAAEDQRRPQKRRRRRPQPRQRPLRRQLPLRGSASATGAARSRTRRSSTWRCGVPMARPRSRNASDPVRMPTATASRTSASSPSTQSRSPRLRRRWASWARSTAVEAA
jgi:hypothetical protein